MPRKSVKHIVKPVEEEVKVEKPPILKTEEVVETPVVAEATSVGQLAQAVEPPVVEPPKIEVKIETEQTPEVKKKLNFLWPIWIAIAFVLGAGAGFGLSRINFERKTPVKTVQNIKPTVSPTMNPTKIPEKVFERSTIKVKVLNGSGVKGKAAIAKEYLESLGYKDVVTGNADRDDYATTELSVKDSLKENTDKIKTDLSTMYEVDNKINTIAADDAYEVLVIIGQK